MKPNGRNKNSNDMDYNKAKDKLEQYEKDGNYPNLKRELLILFDVNNCDTILTLAIEQLLTKQQ